MHGLHRAHRLGLCLYTQHTSIQGAQYLPKLCVRFAALGIDGVASTQTFDRLAVMGLYVYPALGGGENE